MRTKEFSMDLQIITPKDYTVHAYGLPLDSSSEEIKFFFEKHGRDDGVESNVVKVNFPYKIRKYIEYLKKLETVSETINKLEDQKLDLLPHTTGCCKATTLEDYIIEKQALEINIMQYEKDLSTEERKKLLIGQAFITFQTQADARSVEIKYAKE